MVRSVNMYHHESKRNMEAVAWVVVALIWAFSALSFYLLWTKANG